MGGLRLSLGALIFAMGCGGIRRSFMNVSFCCVLLGCCGGGAKNPIPMASSFVYLWQRTCPGDCSLIF
jgi:hypothetical protein